MPYIIIYQLIKCCKTKIIIRHIDVAIKQPKTQRFMFKKYFNISLE